MMQALLDKWVQYYGRQGPVVLLESQSGDYCASRYSYLAALPEATIKAYGQHIEIMEDHQVHAYRGNPWRALKRYRKKWDDWLFGYLGYDLKNSIERLHSLNEDKVGAPDLFFMVPSVLLKIDHRWDQWHLIKGTQPEPIASVEAEKDFRLDTLPSVFSKEDYFTAVQQIQQHIYDGRYYELNLTHQLQAHFSGSSYGLYQKMRKIGPVPFGSFLQFEDWAVCCQSPERFLHKKGSTVVSQPIKGTIRRADTAKEDAALMDRLKKSSKEQAENLMIVDLVRNDLSRIAQKGTVEVSDLFDIQTFGTLHQMVSTIRAESQVKDPVDILKACFPMGSMTGAPKVEVMQAIEKLENYRRGIYSGAIGYISPQADFDFNVVIRTAIIKQQQLYYAVGGAITADSEAEAEWQESWLKAQALLHVFKEEAPMYR